MITYPLLNMYVYRVVTFSFKYFIKHFVPMSCMLKENINETLLNFMCSSIMEVGAILFIHDVADEQCLSNPKGTLWV